MLSPSRFDANVAHHIVQKSQRWTLRIEEFNANVEHMPGEINISADMLTRWVVECSTRCRHISAIHVPLLAEELPELPSPQVLSAPQRMSSPSGNDYNLTTTDGGHRLPMDVQGRLFVPPGNEELQLRIWADAHCAFVEIKRTVLLILLPWRIWIGQPVRLMYMPCSSLIWFAFFLRPGRKSSASLRSWYRLRLSEICSNLTVLTLRNHVMDRGTFSSWKKTSPEMYS